MKRPQKICRGESSRSFKKGLKRLMKKYRRNQWKQFGEDAIVKNIHYGHSE